MRVSLGAPRLIFHPFLGLRYLTHGIVSSCPVALLRFVVFGFVNGNTVFAQGTVTGGIL